MSLSAVKFVRKAVDAKSTLWMTWAACTVPFRDRSSAHSLFPSVRHGQGPHRQEAHEAFQVRTSD